MRGAPDRLALIQRRLRNDMPRPLCIRLPIAPLREHLTFCDPLPVAQGAAQWLHGRRLPLVAKAIGALALIGFGAYGLFHLSNPAAISPLFCITPAH